MQLPKPEHPLVSVARFEDVKREYDGPVSRIMDFYSIAIKRNFNVKMKYGQQEYDFDEGIMFCMSPGQLLRVEVDKTQKIQHSGWQLLFPSRFPLEYAAGKNHQKIRVFRLRGERGPIPFAKRGRKCLSALCSKLTRSAAPTLITLARTLSLRKLNCCSLIPTVFYHRPVHYP